MSIKFEQDKNYIFSLKEYNNLNKKCIPAWVPNLEGKPVLKLSSSVGCILCGGAAAYRIIYPEWCEEVAES